jgi:hypothetical protein
LPINKATATSNDKIYCTFCPIEEKMHKIDSCETKNFGKIYQNDKIHTHWRSNSRASKNSKIWKLEEVKQKIIAHMYFHGINEGYHGPCL